MADSSVATGLLIGTADGLFAADLDGAVDRVLDGRIDAVARYDGRWFAVAGGNRLVRGLDHARRDHAWEQVAEGPRMTAVTVAPESDLGVVFVGTADAQVLRLEDGALVTLDAFDSVAGRDEWHAVGSSVPYVRSLTATADGRTVLANVHVGGIPRTTDGGRSWSPTIEPDADVHEVRAHPTRPEVVVAAAAVGLATSRDGGSTWTVTTAGMHASYARAVVVADDTVIVSASEGPFAQRGALYRRAVDSDGVVERCTDGLPEWFPGNVDTGCIDAGGSTVAVGDGGGSVHLSHDAGREWSRLAIELPPIRAIAVVSGARESG